MELSENQKYMHRCLELARLAKGDTSPNPMVGSIIVHQGKIIGEGFHREYGGPHAEVNAIHSVVNRNLLPESTLYVTLEPCAHHGLTPPCSDLIVSQNIRKVVIGTVDPFAKVAGKGIEKLQNAGIEVVVGVLESQCRDLNRRFFTYHEKQRPYVILKWAQTLDGFIDIDRNADDYGEPTWITRELSLRLVHKLRSAEDAILVGRKTAQKDNPSLSVRHWSGEHPVRAVLDKNLELPRTLKLFDNSVKTVVYNAHDQKTVGRTSFQKINFEEEIIPQIFRSLHKEGIQSLIVEGGRQLLETFIKASAWDEAHQFIGNKFFLNGVRAPHISGEVVCNENLNTDRLIVFRNTSEYNLG